MGFTETDVPDQTGRTVVVTGANTGIGFHTARVLAQRGARVLLACRSQEKAGAAMAEIRRTTPDAELRFVPLDQGDLTSVAHAAALIAQEGRLDVLVNNAGVMMPPYGHTTDGFELQLGVNHLGTFALTGQLLALLDATPGGRVVTTSSLAHRSGRIAFDDLAAARSYDRQERYQQSKLANLLFALELDRRLRAAGSTTASVACHPGIAATELGRHLPTLLRPLVPIVGLLLNSAEQGAWPTLMAATSPTVAPGDYVGPSKRGETAGPATHVRPAGRARDPDTAARLWDVSVELTGVDPGI